MGAILFANDLSMFPSLENKAVIVRKYIGRNNRDLEFEKIGRFGYAVGFEKLIDYIMKNTSVENIEVRRIEEPAYPRVAIREFVANALVHQDFSIRGMSITIEIYANRIVITNPGAPLNDVNRLIDLPPRSRNERLTSTMYWFGMCERRGSGMDRAIDAVEKMHLPAVKIVKDDSSTRVTIYRKKDVKDMTKQEKIDACYQHACLLYEDNKFLNNQGVRERFDLRKDKSSVASRIIADTLEAHLIKSSDECSSKKYATYMPYYV